MGSENLTQEEIDLIRTSWEPVTKNLEAVGKLLFTVMFEKFPQYEEMFKKLQEEGKSLLDSEKFLAHAQKNVMLTMSKLVENLDNDEERKTLLCGVGARHFRRNVRAIHFEKIVEIIMETLRRGLGEAFTDDLSKTWLKMLAINMKIMGDACETAAT